jgi:hypothetical protein
MDYLEEAQLAEESSGTKTHKLLFFIFFGVIFFVIILVVFSIFNAGHKNVSSNKLIEGVALEVGESDVITFDLDEEEHGMFINFVGDGSVELTISSEPINLSLNINEIKEVDLNSDGVFDLKIKLVSIVEEKAVIAFQKIEKESCKEDWECSEWSNCYKAAQKRKCTDLNSCGTIFDRPLVIKGCLEIEFVEDDSAFESIENHSTNTNLTNNSNTNLTDNTNTTPPANYTNQTIPINFTNNTTNASAFVNNTLVNLTNNSNVTVCSTGMFACYENKGFFCAKYFDVNHFNPFCCPKECLEFTSNEQFCLARGYSYFTGNETHICKQGVSSPFNGTNIVCCSVIGIRTNLINQTNATINTSIKNTTITNNQTNTTNPSVCSSGTFPCYESQGFFCTHSNYYFSSGGTNYYSGGSNPLCCPTECLRFNSKEQLCYARGYSYFTGNETHICKVQVYSPFNGTNILCCASIDTKSNINSSAGLSNKI